jgi:hypothetical protein
MQQKLLNKNPNTFKHFYTRVTNSRRNKWFTAQPNLTQSNITTLKINSISYIAQMLDNNQGHYHNHCQGKWLGHTHERTHFDLHQPAYCAQPLQRPENNRKIHSLFHGKY